MAVAMRIAPICGGPSYVQTDSCISHRQSGLAQQRPREQLGEIAGLLETLDRREDQLDRPLRREPLGLQRIGQAEPADDEIGTRVTATIELPLDILALAELRATRQIGRAHV